MIVMNRLLAWGLVPERLIRWVIRRWCLERLQQEKQRRLTSADHQQQLLQALACSEVAMSTTESQQQHYCVPTTFYQLVLGPHLKYSCGDWSDGVNTLADSETSMLQLVAERAELGDGQRILELGCGWGSLTLWMAERYPHADIVAVSHSPTQKQWIDAQCRQRGLSNCQIITQDINEFEAPGLFDRIISVEMFEHVRNYAVLMQRIRRWCRDDGCLFVHHFCHRDYLYEFDPEESHSWMAKYFFTNGLMPADDTLDHFQKGWKKSAQWRVNGRHYARTCEAWLAQLKRNQAAALTVLREHNNGLSAALQLAYWKIFILSCAELFATNEGDEWYVKHILWRPE
jgi:cyclopropane-fatty-acyl-phospholipid synthase